MQLLLKNINQLVTVHSNGKSFKSGISMRDLGVIQNASVLIDNGIFQWIGLDETFAQPLREDAEIVDASSFVALPGFVDAHTHLLFAGSRENEFALRAEGKTYQEIAAQGGGILSTVKATRAATKKELKKLASKRLDAMMKHGTTTAEIKSGYGLDVDSEIKMLEAITELAEEHFMTIAPTFLGAHAVPPEFKDRKEEYIKLVCNTMMPYIAKRNLARFCDVFCETGYFSAEESRQILQCAQSLGLKLKLHAEEFNSIGGTALAAELQAVSVDHLEHIDEEGIRKLQKGSTVAVALPGVSFFLHNPYAPARKLIDAGLPLAIASDFNPGSCMSFSMPLMMTIACTQMNLTPEEAITACTLNGAAALGLSQTVGSIEVGKQADIILYDIPDYRYLAYHFGTNLVAKVIKRGVILEFP
ncbi:MAG: imidazolonepropionase [Ignavibacteriales bacterium]|nr:imidazolonepropionase [Ignavibacteriales bacterium]